MEPENGELFVQKLKESIQLNQQLLTIAGETHSKVNECKLQFQGTLQEIIEQSKSILPLFETMSGKLSEEENKALIDFAMKSTGSHQQLFEVWKTLKDLEAQAGNDLTAAADKVKSFTL